MGSLTGHMISGGLLVFFGIWHVFNVFLFYFRAMRSGRKFESRACWPAPCCPNSVFPFEAIFKLGLVLLWGTIEFIVITWDKGLYGQQGQHGSMEYLIASTGIVDFLVYFNRNNRWPWLPKKANYGYTAFIFLLQKYILANHHPDKMHMNIEGTMHMFLVDIAFALSIMIVVEMIFTNHFGVAIMRSFLIILEGSWLWTIGIVIYYVNNLSNEKTADYQLVSLYFAYNGVITLVFVFFIGFLVHLCMGCPKPAVRSHLDEEDGGGENIKSHYATANGTRSNKGISQDKVDLLSYSKLTAVTDD